MKSTPEPHPNGPAAEDRGRLTLHLRENDDFGGDEGPAGGSDGPTTEDVNPFAFRLSDFELRPDEVGVEDPGAGIIAVGRPGPQVFFRANPDFQAVVRMIELRDGGEGSYLLSSALAKAFEEESKPKDLRLLQTRFGGYLVYPLGLPNQDGRTNTWIASARQAVQEATTHWIRMVSDRALGQYLVKPAKDQDAMPPVSWPTLSREEVLGRAFSTGNLITKPDHPVLLRLQGLRSV